MDVWTVILLLTLLVILLIFVVQYVWDQTEPDGGPYLPSSLSDIFF